MFVNRGLDKNPQMSTENRLFVQVKFPQDGTGVFGKVFKEISRWWLRHRNALLQLLKLVEDDVDLETLLDCLFGR